MPVRSGRSGVYAARRRRGGPRWNEMEPALTYLKAGGIMPNIWRRHAGDASALPEQKVLTRPALEEPGRFGGAQTVGDYVILNWVTAHGVVGWAHSLRSGNSAVRQLADAVYDQFWDHTHQVYAVLVLPQAAVNL